MKSHQQGDGFTLIHQIVKVLEEQGYSYDKVEQLAVNIEAVDIILTGVAEAIDNLSRPDFHLLKMAIGRIGAPQPDRSPLDSNTKLLNTSSCCQPVSFDRPEAEPGMVQGAEASN